MKHFNLTISLQLILLLIVHLVVVITTYFMTVNIQNKVKNDSMIINMLGQIRGGIQREAKGFIYSINSSDKKEFHTDIKKTLKKLTELCQKDFKHMVPVINNLLYHYNELNGMMHISKKKVSQKEIELVLNRSENLWELTDTAVLLVQKSSEEKHNEMKYIYYMLYTELILLLFLIYTIYIKINKTLEYKNLELNKIFNASPDITLITTGNELIRANDKFFKFTDYPNLEEFKKKYDCICDMFEKRKGYLTKLVDGKVWIEYVLDNPNSIHKAMIIKDGVEHIFSISAEEFFVKDKQEVVAVLTDITTLEHLSTTDQLTNISNRKKIEEFTHFCIDMYFRHDKSFSIILLDIDPFKDVNDSYGHDVGDYVLKEFTSIIKADIRTIDLLGRWGGEEFLIVCPETDLNRAQVIAQKIRKKIENHDFDKVKRVTASFGVAEFNKDLDYNSLLKNADNALYRAKENGRNRVEI